MRKFDFMRRRVRVPLFVSSLFLILMSGGCDESLPSYREPGAVLDGRVMAAYVLTASENRIRIFVTAVNTYEETLEGRRILSGSVEIRSKRKPELRATVSFTSSNVIYARNTSSQTGMIRLDPGDSVRFMVSWDSVGDDAAGGDGFVGLFSYFIDPACPGPPPQPVRSIAFRETFVLSGEVRVFEQAGPAVFGPAEFSFCRISQWVPPSGCPSVDPNACRDR